jgi:hypothetical protein
MSFRVTAVSIVANHLKAHHINNIHGEAVLGVKTAKASISPRELI